MEEMEGRYVPSTVLVPFEGQEFESELVAYDFYNDYAYKTGFSVRKQYKNWDPKTKIVTSRQYSCSKVGFREVDKRNRPIKKPRAETRTGCLAKMNIVLNRGTNKYCVQHFVEEHNHLLHISACSHMMRSQRRITDVQAGHIELADASGIPLRLSYEQMGMQAGGRENLGFTRVDQKNYLAQKRARNMESGEAGTLLRYLCQRQKGNLAFYYSVQLDIEEMITNIFWADARMIADYDVFGDAITFDTTYKTNNAHRPLAVFAGFNHHKNTMIFEAALMYDETIESFKWLFECFLEAMSQKKPKTIFTDQDAAIAKAVSIVMPETYHGLCTFHLMRNATKHLASIDGGESGLLATLSACIYKYEEKSEFQAEWDAMILKYNMQSNSWLQSILELKHKWARAFMRSTFTLDMRSTQLSESLNSSLKDYLKSEYNIQQFFEHFERAVTRKRYNELNVEYGTREKLPQIRMKNSLMLAHAATVYTPYAFVEFQEEFDASLGLRIKVKEVHCTNQTFVIAPHKEDTKTSTVLFNATTEDFSCTCRKFEITGILCSHVIKVFLHMDLEVIPERYILKRWTKEARNLTIEDISYHEILGDATQSKTEQYRMICRLLIGIATCAVEYEEASDLVLNVATKLAQQVNEICNKKSTVNLVGSVEPILDGTPTNGVGEQTENTTVNGVVPAGIKRRQGRKGKRRLKSWVDNLPKKKAGRKSRTTPITNNS